MAKMAKKMTMRAPGWENSKISLIDRAVIDAKYRKDVREQRKRDKAHPTVCDCEGGKDWGIASSQD
jgi:hypothetical protein